MTINLSHYRRYIAVGAGVALLGWAVLGRQWPQQALLGYLAAYLFCLGPALGSAALLMVHALTGGAWGFDLRAPLLAATRVLPLLALLLLPILFGARLLYPWLQPHAQTAQLAYQQWYLNLPFFLGRAVVVFALWLGLAFGLRRRLFDLQLTRVTPRFAAAGLIVFALSITVAAVDWVMSLVPTWHSSTFGLIVGTGQLLAAAALAVFCITGPGWVAPAPARVRDLGSLLLMLVLAWSYLVFMDYLTAWIADLPGETVWYLPRLKSSWQWLGVALVIFHLLLPMAILLSGRAKQQRRWMRGVAALLLFAQAAYALWLVAPSFRPHGFALTWSDALAGLGLGGWCWALFDTQLAQLRRAAISSP